MSRLAGVLAVLAVLVPESARPIVTWLDRETRPNDIAIVTMASLPARVAPLRRITMSSDEPDATAAQEVSVPRSQFGYTVGKDGWWVVVDRARRLMLYGEHCCSFSRAVVARYRSEPPAVVPNADILKLTRMRRVAIGMNSSQIVRVFGPPGPRLPALHSARWDIVYSYPWKVPTEGSECADIHTLTFERDRLVAYEIWWGC